jgi:hypothetical protein
MMRIHTKALALSCGIVFGLIICVKTLAGFFFGYAPGCLELFSGAFPGYSVSIVGSVIGLLYGFISGGIIGGLVGFFYNRLFVRL